MKKSYSLLKPLTEQLMKEVSVYGILEVSTEQYQTVCNRILRFAQSSQTDRYSPELMDSYRNNLDKSCFSGEICKGYARFQLRVVRMLSSLAETGVVDFTNAKQRWRKYLVSDDAGSLVEKILDSQPISDATKSDLSAPTRHYALALESMKQSVK